MANQSPQAKNENSVLYLVQLGLLSALIILMAFTPLGYLKVGLVEITFITIPVVIGAIILGPTGGAILGGIFGITSFIQCFGISAFGTLLFGINPIFTIITCFIPRILVGFLTGVIFNTLYKIDKTKIASYGVASLCGALLNTILFMTCILVFFWKNGDFLSTMRESKLPTASAWKFLIAFVGVNGLVEACVTFVVGGTLAKILLAVKKGKR